MLYLVCMLTLHKTTMTAIQCHEFLKRARLETQETRPSPNVFDHDGGRVVESGKRVLEDSCHPRRKEEAVVERETGPMQPPIPQHKLRVAASASWNNYSVPSRGTLTREREAELRDAKRNQCVMARQRYRTFQDSGHRKHTARATLNRATAEKAPSHRQHIVVVPVATSSSMASTKHTVMRLEGHSLECCGTNCSAAGNILKVKKGHTNGR